MSFTSMSSLIICSKYGKVTLNYCANHCVNRGKNARCSKFVMQASSAETLGCVPRVECRDKEGNFDGQASVVGQKESELIGKREEEIYRKKKKIFVTRAGF